MSVEHVYFCNGPGCDAHIRSVDAAPRGGWLLVTAGEPDQRHTFDFCSWDCVMRYGATLEPVDVTTTGGVG